MLSQVMMNCWLGKSQKIPFHQQLWKMFTTRAGEKMILAMSTQISRSLKFIQYLTLIRLDTSTSSILLQVRCLMPLQSKQTYSLQSPSCSPINTSRKLIKIFLGVYFRMVLPKLPSQRLHWKTFMTYSRVWSVIRRNRFKALFRDIHFVNNLDVNQEEKSDRLRKLWPWVKKIVLQVSWEEYHVVDEIMVPFKGKSLLPQYMPKKPHKWGFKLWARSGVSGFLYDYDIYQSKVNANP